MASRFPKVVNVPGVCVPYFSLARAEWIPRVVTWDAETGFFERVDGPEGFREYRTALEASRFLLLRLWTCW